MHKLIGAGLALVAFAAPTTPASADWSVTFVANPPNCSYISTNDPTGQVIQDPNTQTGIVIAGPVVVVPPFSTSVRCNFKINYGINDSTNIAAQRVSGGEPLLVDTITFTALPGDDVYICTVVFIDDTGHHVDDDDDDSNGIQCALATSVEA